MQLEKSIEASSSGAFASPTTVGTVIAPSGVVNPSNAVSENARIGISVPASTSS